MTNNLDPLNSVIELAGVLKEPLPVSHFRFLSDFPESPVRQDVQDADDFDTAAVLTALWYALTCADVDEPCMVRMICSDPDRSTCLIGLAKDLLCRSATLRPFCNFLGSNALQLGSSVIRMDRHSASNLSKKAAETDLSIIFDVGSTEPATAAVVADYKRLCPRGKRIISVW